MVCLLVVVRWNKQNITIFKMQKVLAFHTTNERITGYLFLSLSIAIRTFDYPVVEAFDYLAVGNREPVADLGQEPPLISSD